MLHPAWAEAGIQAPAMQENEASLSGTGTDASIAGSASEASFVVDAPEIRDDVSDITNVCLHQGGHAFPTTLSLLPTFAASDVEGGHRVNDADGDEDGDKEDDEEVSRNTRVARALSSTKGYGHVSSDADDQQPNATRAHCVRMVQYVSIVLGVLMCAAIVGVGLGLALFYRPASGHASPSGMVTGRTAAARVAG